MENLQFVALTIAKDKQARGERIEMEAFLDEGG
jgi:hypothetical protein